MAHPILNEDWSDYDNKKLRWEDRYFFACSEKWEVDYLLKKARKYTLKSDADIMRAISSCCGIMSGNKPRDKFVECVMTKL